MRAASALAVVLALAACGADAVSVDDAASPAPSATAPPPPAHEHDAPALDVDASAPVDASTPDRTVAIASAGDTACTFELLARALAPGDEGLPRWSVLLMKTDTRAGSCDGNRGTLTLAPSSYERPTGFVAVVAQKKWVVVTFAGQFAPSAIVYTRLVQVDYETGALLHEGEMVVQGTPLWPPAPALRPTRLDASGRDVVLAGTGDFPGAGGGDAFTATYVGFLDDEKQRPSPATYAVSF